MNTSILVMEDDTSIQELIVEFLKAEGYDVDFASDGLEGIQLFKKKEYDLVLLDIMMPKLDGMRTCLKIRESRNIPIIFFMKTYRSIILLELMDYLIYNIL